ncbi:septum site-determining protein MinC [Cytobacillus gottheilii]|uniref:Probable septum site-determining protein MinC n=1 Tax=Cytobacillus gottheilii TaxID=859144 RepID=A0ABX8F9R9_9BACI|nr:septum site-determining protein MinC [Cytobacillus gottheilii]QVY60533.1 septum site-determining protein MinC [Cytobacillus gottheilii]
MKKYQNVTIKGTKEGLTLHLDDTCSYSDLKEELDQKLSESSKSQSDKLISVMVQVGNRYLTADQKEELRELIRQKKNLVVDTINSNVITKQEAEAERIAHEVVSIAKIVRSGQVLEVAGDLLLIGDVNPGGTVKAGGNIYILGALKGIAHAGCSGNREAVIAASVMKPSQLRIEECLNRAPDHYPGEDGREMECAYIDENNQITIDRLQALMNIRPNLSKLQGGF